VHFYVNIIVAAIAVVDIVVIANIIITIRMIIIISTTRAILSKYTQSSIPVFTWTYYSPRLCSADHQTVALATNVFFARRRRPHRLHKI